MRRLVVSFYALVLADEVLLIGLIPLAPTFADRFGLSKTETGALLAASAVATVLASVPVGVLADRLGARRLSLASGVLIAAAALGQGLADSYPQLLAARFAFGIGSATLWTAGAAWISDSVPTRRRSAALGAIMVVAGVGGMIGPVYAGFLAEHVGVGTPFLVGAAVALAVTAALALASPGRSEPHGHQPLLETLGAARGEPLVLGALAVMVIAGLSDGAVGLLAPLQLDANGVSPGAIGAAFSAAAAVYLVVSTVVARLGDRPVRLGTGAAGSLLLAVAFVPVLLSASTVAVVATIIGRMPAAGLLYTICFPLGTLGAVRAGIGRGAVLGVLNLGWGSATLVAPVVAGVIADASSERVAYGVLTGICAGTAAWLFAAAWQAQPEGARSG
jgi:MFS family permease